MDVRTITVKVNTVRAPENGKDSKKQTKMHDYCRNILEDELLEWTERPGFEGVIVEFEYLDTCKLKKVRPVVRYGSAQLLLWLEEK